MSFHKMKVINSGLVLRAFSCLQGEEGMAGDL